ncbi:large exoprotein [Microbacterium sp. NPDC055910]|uniref:large exoprotein n=1 Tax=Microbacterium sp. NPDC055910 TaxID=3345659 RepID=UPI0035D793B4
MGGQVLGGGVIVLVAALLWLVYLLPSWHSRRQYDASERNAVRLNQALRVLAETSETPEEVRLELTARTALAQQKLARRALAEREQVALEEARIELERARDERAAARLSPEARRARARRRVRLTAMTLGVAGLGIAGWGVWTIVSTGAQLLLWAGLAATIVAGLVLQRMARVGARAVTRTAQDAGERVAVHMQDVELEQTRREWAPRELPRPLTASAGSRAAAVLDAEDAREALRLAAVDEAIRRRAEAQRPTSIETARPQRAASADFSRMGYVDDAEIEAHVRDVLLRRASGQ